MELYARNRYKHGETDDIFRGIGKMNIEEFETEWKLSHYSTKTIVLINHDIIYATSWTYDTELKDRVTLINNGQYIGVIYLDTIFSVS